MQYRPEYSERALEDLSCLDARTAHRIIDKVAFFTSHPDPLYFAKSLSGEFQGSYRYRIGDYRVLFYLAFGKELIIMKIYKVGHRRDIYE